MSSIYHMNEQYLSQEWAVFITGTSSIYHKNEQYLSQELAIFVIKMLFLYTIYLNLYTYVHIFTLPKATFEPIKSELDVIWYPHVFHFSCVVCMRAVCAALSSSGSGLVLGMPMCCLACCTKMILYPPGMHRTACPLSISLMLVSHSLMLLCFQLIISNCNWLGYSIAVVW